MCRVGPSTKNSSQTQHCKSESEGKKEQKQRILHWCEIAFLCTVHVYVDFLTYVGHLFGFLPNLPHCNSIFFWFFGILSKGLAITAPRPSTVGGLLD